PALGREAQVVALQREPDPIPDRESGDGQHDDDSRGGEQPGAAPAGSRAPLAPDPAGGRGSRPAALLRRRTSDPLLARGSPHSSALEASASSIVRRSLGTSRAGSTDAGGCSTCCTASDTSA